MLFVTLLNGIPAIAYFLTIAAHIQSHVADQYRGRILGAFGTVQSLLLLLGMGVGGLLGDRVGITVMFEAVAGLGFVSGGLMYVLARGTNLQPHRYLDQPAT